MRVHAQCDYTSIARILAIGRRHPLKTKQKKITFFVVKMAEWTYSDQIVKGVVQVSNRNRVRSIRDHVYNERATDRFQ